MLFILDRVFNAVDRLMPGSWGHYCKVIASGLCSLSFLLFTFVFGFCLVDDHKALEWDKTDAVIISSNVINKSKRTGYNQYDVNIRFEYVYKGQKYSSTRYNFNTSNASFDKNKLSFSGLKEAQDFADKFYVNRKVFCYVNPDSPEVVYILTPYFTDDYIGLTILASLYVFSTLFFIYYFMALIKYYRKDKVLNEQETLYAYYDEFDNPKPNGIGTAINNFFNSIMVKRLNSFLLGLLLLCLGTMPIIGFFINNYEDYSSSSWPQVQCCITDYNVIYPGKHDNHITIYFEYDYEYDNKKYTSSNVKSVDTRIMLNTAQWLSDNLKPETITHCRVNPECHMETFLITEMLDFNVNVKLALLQSPAILWRAIGCIPAGLVAIIYAFKKTYRDETLLHY